MTSLYTTQPATLLLDLVEFFLLCHLYDLIVRVQKLFSGSQSVFESKLGHFCSTNAFAEKKSRDFESEIQDIWFSKSMDDSKLSREEVKMVMANLGIHFTTGSDSLQERLGSHELSNVFEDEEPSLREIKEAFHVFDTNKDGFIDAVDLQRVLRSLGLREGSDLDDCRKMIRGADENGDGKIDFKEFIRFMENRFC